MTVSRSFIFRVRNVGDKFCKENQNTQCTLNSIFPKIVPFMR